MCKNIKREPYSMWDAVIRTGMVIILMILINELLIDYRNEQQKGKLKQDTTVTDTTEQRDSIRQRGNSIDENSFYPYGQ